MSFAGAPAAAAGTRGNGNAGEADQVAGVSGVQAQPQAAIESGDQVHPQAAIVSGDQVHPQAAIRSDDQVQPQSPQEFVGEQADRIVLLEGTAVARMVEANEVPGTVVADGTVGTLRTHRWAKEGRAGLSVKERRKVLF